LTRTVLPSFSVQPLDARVVVNTIHDRAPATTMCRGASWGLSRLAAIELPRRLNAVKRGIGKLPGERGFLLADLARHGSSHRRNDG
jgi:hypothetical protein